MEYRPDLTIMSDSEVYPPSEDSVMFIEALEIRRGMRVLEIGCGSGVVSIHCALNGAEVTCGDVNPKAVELANRNAEANGVRINAVGTDVYSGIDGKFDLILFNLPYLPVDEEGELAKAWSGGEDGMGPLPRLLEGAPEHLLPGGRVAVVVSSLMDRKRLEEVIGGRPCRVLKELPLFFEKLSVLEISF
ncbi:HemK-related putative methylase [Thermoplasmatales archaeon BRNA1]|nr:HemK-related putative methylase [Thermoplasmatales archaeon BRNA1]